MFLAPSHPAAGSDADGKLKAMTQPSFEVLLRVPTGSSILYECRHPAGSSLGCHKCLGYKMSTGPWRHPSIVAVIAFEAICGLKSEVDHTTFPTKTESIKPQSPTKAVTSKVRWHPFVDLSKCPHGPNNYWIKVFVVPYVTYHAPFKVPNSAGAGDTIWLIEFEVAWPMWGADRVE